MDLVDILCVTCVGVLLWMTICFCMGGTQGFTLARKMDLVNAKSRPTAMNVQGIALKEDEPLVLHFPGEGPCPD